MNDTSKMSIIFGQVDQELRMMTFHDIVGEIVMTHQINPNRSVNPETCVFA